MHIPVAVPASLPLEHVKPRRGGKADSRVHHVEPGESLVSLADELSLNMLVFFAQCGVVRACRPVGDADSPLLELVANRLEHVPVAFVV